MALPVAKAPHTAQRNDRSRMITETISRSRRKQKRTDFSIYIFILKEETLWKIQRLNIKVGYMKTPDLCILIDSMHIWSLHMLNMSRIRRCYGECFQRTIE